MNLKLFWCIIFTKSKRIIYEKKNQKNIAEILSENNSLALIEVNLAQAEMKKAGLKKNDKKMTMLKKIVKDKGYE